MLAIGGGSSWKLRGPAIHNKISCMHVRTAAGCIAINLVKRRYSSRAIYHKFGLVQKVDSGLWTGLWNVDWTLDWIVPILGARFSSILLITKAPGGKAKMEEDADVIVLSSESDDDDITLCNEDVKIEYSSDNSESILFPISPAKKVFTPTKRLRSSPISDNSDSDDLGKSERYVFGLVLLIKSMAGVYFDFTDTFDK